MIYITADFWKCLMQKREHIWHHCFICGGRMINLALVRLVYFLSRAQYALHSFKLITSVFISESLLWCLTHSRKIMNMKCLKTNCSSDWIRKKTNKINSVGTYLTLLYHGKCDDGCFISEWSFFELDVEDEDHVDPPQHLHIS